MAKFNFWQWLQFYIVRIFLLPMRVKKEDNHADENKPHDIDFPRTLEKQLKVGEQEQLMHSNKVVERAVAPAVSQQESALVTKAAELRDDIVAYLYPLLTPNKEIPDSFTGLLALVYASLDLDDIDLPEDKMFALAACQAILRELLEINYSNYPSAGDLKLSKYDFRIMNDDPQKFDEDFRIKIMEKYYQALQLPNLAPKAPAVTANPTVHSPSSRQR